MKVNALKCRRKGMLLLGVLSACFSGFVAQSNAATYNTTLSVSGTVPVTCTATTTPIQFPDLTDGQKANGDVQVTCNDVTLYSVSLGHGLNYDANANNGAGSRRMSGAPNSYAAYGLYLDAAATQPWGDAALSEPALTNAQVISPGQPDVHVVYGVVELGGATIPGNYSDTVDVVVDY